MLNRTALALSLMVATVVVPAAPLFAQSYNGYHGGLRPLPRPTPTPGPGGYAPVTRQPQQDAPDASVSEAVREARMALSQYRGFEAGFHRAASDQERAAIQGYMAQLTSNALQAILSRVADTSRDDSSNRVLVYQIARDALGSGNNSGDPAARIAYNVDALRKIASLPVW